MNKLAMNKLTILAVAAAVGVGLAGCESATGPSDGGTMEVAMQGDSEPGGAGAESAPSSDSSPSGASRAEGSLDVKARVWVQAASGTWVEVTPGAAARAVVDAAGRGGAKAFASARVDARSYTRVRVEFEDVRANVTGGIGIGGGLLTGEVRVGSGGNVVVERTIDVHLQQSGTARVVVDLNASQWLGQADAQTRVVSRAAFESAVKVLVG